MKEVTYDFLTAIKCAEAVKEYLRPVSWRGTSRALRVKAGQLIEYGLLRTPSMPTNDELFGQWEVIDLSAIKREEQ